MNNRDRETESPREHVSADVAPELFADTAELNR